MSDREINQETNQKADLEALAADFRALGQALVQDAAGQGEAWTPEQVGVSYRDSLHLQTANLLQRTYASTDDSFKRGRQEERLEAVEHLVRGLAERLLVERLHSLYCFATLAHRPERVLKATTNLASHKRSAVRALSILLEDKQFTEASENFLQAAKQIPEGFEMFSIDTDEYAVAYWDGVETVACEFSEAVGAYLASINEFGDELRGRAMLRRYHFLTSKRRRIQEQIGSILQQLDGERLHKSKEVLRRQLESRDAPEKEGSLSDTFVGRFLGRKVEPKKPAASDRDEAQETFGAIEKLTSELKANRDRLRQKLASIDQELRAAGFPSDSNASLIQSKRQRIDRADLFRSVERFQRMRAPVKRLLDTCDASLDLPALRTLMQFGKVLDTMAPSDAFLTATEIGNRLLHVYSMDPIRFLDVCLVHKPVRQVHIFDSPRRRTVSLAAWLELCESDAKRTDYSVERYLTEVAHAAPERFARGVIDECRLLLGASDVAAQVAQKDAMHKGKVDRRLATDRRSDDRRRVERRTNVIAVDFERRDLNRRQSERRAGSRRG